MSRVLSCGAVNNSLTSNVVKVSSLVSTNYIVPNGNGEIYVQGLTPSIVVANIPINEDTFDANGDSLVAFIAGPDVRLVSIGEIHVVSSSVSSSVSVLKNGTVGLTSLTTFDDSANVSRIVNINTPNNILLNGDLIVLKLFGGVLTDLQGGVITLTFVVL